MKPVKIFNNLSRTKEELKYNTNNGIKFYSCGPTTYDFLHVGNARALVVGDFIYRSLKALGHDVIFVRNFTDVDDKIIKRAKEMNEDAIEYAAKFIKECQFDMNELNLLSPSFSPKVSETMPEIINMIKDIINNGKAYVKDGEVLFSTKLASNYGKLSKKNMSELRLGNRVAVADNKNDANDFVLWKPAKEGEVSWDSPWGKGRPGWHIECSAMAKKHLGETIDLHHGGVDLMFPHHENEIAQSEAANNCPFCDNWVHNEFLNFGSEEKKEKMSKSLGNIIRIRDFNNKYSGQVLKHLLLSVNYRSPLDWDEKLVTKAVDEVKVIHKFYLEALELKYTNGTYNLNKYVDRVKDELANDFSSASVFALFFTFMKEVNSNKANLSSESINEVINMLWLFNNELGLISNEAVSLIKKLDSLSTDLSKASIAEEEIQKVISARLIAKQNKDWAKSDELRNYLKSKNIVLNDNPDGTCTWVKK